MSNKIVLLRQELYEKVWSTQMIKLAKEYNLSDNGLRKICKLMEIPLPPAGHWIKLQYGKKTKIIPLPEATPDTRTEYIIDLNSPKFQLTRPKGLQQIKMKTNLRDMHPILQNSVKYVNGDKDIDWVSHMSLSCSKENKKRVLLIYATVFRELEVKGYKFDIVSHKRDYMVSAVKDNIKIPFRIRELTYMKKVDNPKNSWDNRVEFTYKGKLIMTN